MWIPGSVAIRGHTTMRSPRLPEVRVQCAVAGAAGHLQDHGRRPGGTRCGSARDAGLVRRPIPDPTGPAIPAWRAANATIILPRVIRQARGQALWFEKVRISGK